MDKKFFIMLIVILVIYRFSLFFRNYEKFEDINVKMITPQTMTNLFNENNVAIVNTLSNDYHINTKPINLKNNYGKDFIDTMTNKKLKNFKLIVLYCANYTCAAAKKYYKKLTQKFKKLKNKLVFYEGGIFEWGYLSINHPSKFSIVNNNKKLNANELINLVKGYSHWNETKKDYVKYPKIVIDNSFTSNFYTNLKLSQQKSSSNSGKLLENKVCVVTGGTSGLGLNTVHKMLENGAKHVTLTYFNNKERADKVSKELINKYGGDRIHVLRADARSVEGNFKTFNRNERKKYLKKDYGPVDCVDINAGIFGPANLNFKHIHNINDEDYDKVMKINLRGYYLGVKHFTKQAIENNVEDAAIVCIKSIYGSTGSLFSNIAYQISKHGVMGLVRQSAVELARENKLLKLKHPIRVNAVSPTFTNTALTRPFLEKDLINDIISNSNTMNNLANADDVANAVVYLLSDNSKSITGIDLPVDCGVLAESIPTYNEVKKLNDSNIEELSCCGDTL